MYDEAGNLIKKGNRYNIEGDSVILIETEGSGVEYWEYEYNLQNRLSRVRKNGELIAEFLYDADGMRIKSEEKEEESSTIRTTYYVYSYSGSVLMEESTDNSSDDSSETKYTSYIYAFAKTFAKVDGILDPVHITAEKIAYFHHDNLGSTRLMTDGAGNVVMDQDYMPFGEDLPVVGQTEVLDEEAGGYKYTGQKEVVSIGLYYYGARYYDPSIGRFITEDIYPGEMENPQSQNLYVYVMNNPLRYIDPTGNSAENALGYTPDFIISYNNTELVFSFELAWENLKYDPDFIKKLMIEIPYPGVSLPTFLELLPEFTIKESINYGSGKMLEPVIGSISNKIDNKIASKVVEKSIDFYSGEVMDRLINGFSSSERKRQYLTNIAIEMYNTILQETNADNARILSIWNEKDIIKSSFWDTTVPNYYNSILEYINSQIVGVSTAVITGSPNAGYLLNSAANFYNAHYPVEYKKGDIIRVNHISYITKNDFINGHAIFKVRLMSLHQVIRDDKIYQAYLHFRTLPLWLSESSRTGMQTFFEQQERKHGAIF